MKTSAKHFGLVVEP